MLKCSTVFGLALAVVLCSIFTTIQGDECPMTRNRNQWGADEPSSSYNLNSEPGLVLIKEAGSVCENRRQCAHEVKDVQVHDMSVDGYPDIYCNFLIGSDGLVYEGRGWEYGAFSKSSLVICMLGHFDTKPPNSIQTKTLENFIICSFEQDRLSPYYKVQAWSDIWTVLKGQNPGRALYEVIRSLPRYSAPPSKEVPTPTPSSEQQ